MLYVQHSLKVSVHRSASAGSDKSHQTDFTIICIVNLHTSVSADRPNASARL